MTLPELMVFLTIVTLTILVTWAVTDRFDR